MKRWIGFFILSLNVIVSESIPYTKCMKKPHYKGKTWESMTAQSANNKVSITKEHECQNIPSKFDVQIRPSSGPNSDFIFPGLPSAQRDDDVNSTYAGLVYYYRKGDAQIFAPRQNPKNTGFHAGKTIFTGYPHWQGPKDQSEDSCQFRLRVWCQYDILSPDFTSNWTQISNKTSYLEIKHAIGREPELVTITVDLDGQRYCDGIGSTSAFTKNDAQWGGVIYGYDNDYVRIWAPSKGGALFSVKDGWGLNDNHNDQYFSGKVQVRVWSRVDHTFTYRFTVGPGSKGKEIDLPTTVDVDSDIVFVTVKATDGNNKGFSFPASGAVQNAMDSGSYGGVVYSYSASKLRYWLPPLQPTSSNGPHGYLVYINNEYGNGTNMQKSTSAEIAVHVWKSGTTCQLLPNATLPPTTTTTSTTQAATLHSRNKYNGSSSEMKEDPNKNTLSRRSVLILHIASGVLVFILLITIITLVIIHCKNRNNGISPNKDEDTKT